MSVKKLLGLKIKKLRKEKKISQEYFSELVSMNPRQIVRIENGESFPTAENLEKIAKALDISIQNLFYNENFLPPKILRQKIVDEVDKMSENKLQTLYVIIQNF